ncbi:DUF6121 family protein [Frondihabitans sp. VKM Ac-2883]|uniref:DUF6121 family protein n=1 Tax=Frondihabitans sp. VKM Ac-2883 TaxID=2783823 RepID=UPI00188C55EE|nr:DUF6121 family protein [Frondihabitans sp. VKM Ac-2883]MBF4574918.1 hypothetical protein [Frondihabitans sp. VKM Ac-2883]
MSRGLLAFLATVTHLALAVLTAGLLFYVTGRDLIVESDAGTTLGPTMVLASMATVFFVLARSFGVAEREPERRQPRILASALITLATSYVAMLAVGAVLYSLRRSEAVWLVLFTGRYALSTFVIATTVWAAIVVAGTLLLDRAERHREGR